MPNKYAKMTLKELSDCGGQPGSIEGIYVSNQFSMRTARAQIWATRWMALSVTIIAIASAADLWLSHF